MISHWLLALWSNKRSYKASVVTIMHLQDIVDRTKVYGLYGVGLDWITSKVDKVVTISNSVTNTLSTEFHRKVKKLYNPVVNAGLPTKRDKSEFLRVGMFARYTPWKGHKDLLRIAKYCSDGGIKFRCFGNVSDEEEAYYEELRAEEKALGDKITLNRFTPEVIKEMVNCDLILHLSVLPEPFGRILIEANVCKVPVFAYKGGAVEELYKELGLAGKLFENRDWESVAKAISSFDRRDYTFPDLSILNPSIYVDRLLSLIEESQ